MGLIRIENLNELSEVRNLAFRIWQEHYVPIIGQAQVDFMLENMYDLDSLGRQVASGDLFYLIEDTAQYVGFISIKESEPNSWFLNKLYVEMGDQRKGLGAAVLKEIWEKHAVNEMRLQVNRQNYKAINFYFKMGFVIERVADFDIGGGYYMNDFVMLWRR